MNEKPKILIIDDIELNLILTEKNLDTFYTIYKAQSYEEALKILGEQEINLILLDIMMPDPDGFELCKRLKNNELHSEIPVVFLTAKTDSESLKQGFEVGAVDYITKPFNQKELFARVKNHIELDLSKKLLKKELKLRKELEKKIIAEIYKTEEEERTRFAKEIHDGLGVLLSSIKIYLNMLETSDVQKDDFKKNIKYANELIIEAVTTAKEIANKIYPNILERYGLVEALKIYFEKIKTLSKTEIFFTCRNVETLKNRDTEIILFRIINELINNTLKYSKANSIQIKIEKINSKIKLQYKDNGIGFDVEKAISSKKMGLSNIFQRVKAIDGECKITSRLEKGMTAEIEI